MPADSWDVDVQIVVVAKEPVPGRVKTRLTPPLTPLTAARVAAAALVDTLQSVAETPVVRRTVALAGAAGPWLPEGFAVIQQRGDGLDERLASAFEDAQQVYPAPVLLIGMDTPHITASLLHASCRALLAEGNDAVIGPATDGGWWAMGLRRAERDLLVGVPMSTSRTFDEQLGRLRRAALSVTLLPILTDVDDVRTGHEVARQCPRSRFAAEWNAAAVVP